jgi:ADP-ribose pyrophosphatase YjhB (NUDIX family)
MSVGGQLAHLARRAWWRLRRPKTRGARVIVTRGDGQICLVRHSYGEGWYLPGGGLRRWEGPDDGLRREAREELGVELGDLALLGTYEARAEGKRDTVWVFAARAGGPGGAVSTEIDEVGWFLPDCLPEGVSPATRRRIAEWAGLADPTGVW